MSVNGEHLLHLKSLFRSTICDKIDSKIMINVYKTTLFLIIFLDKVSIGTGIMRSRIKTFIKKITIEKKLRN